MAQDVSLVSQRRGLGAAIAGVIFCDFIGFLLLSVGSIGWLLAVPTMFLGSPYAAWMALATHPKRRSLIAWIGVINGLVLIALGVALVAAIYYLLSNARWG